MGITKKKRIEIHNKYDQKCAYCGQDIEYKDMQVDHIVPKEKGGTNEMENLNPACRQCNFYKDTFTIEEFRQNLSTITERVRKPFIFRLSEKYGLVEIIDKPIVFYFETKKNDLDIS